MSTTIASIDPSRLQGEVLDPHQLKIQNWMRRFGFRQTGILLAQGIAFAVLCLIACASILVLLDTLRWIDDPSRWALSVGMYVLSAGVGLWYGIARLWRKDDSIQSAKHIEHGSPDLDESLLSLVELQQVPAERRHFSPEFLRAIERSVAQQLEGLSVSKILPWSLVRSSLLGALGALGFIGVLCGLPGLDMTQRFARAFFPFMEIQRPSKTKIWVRSPAREDSVVPENQSVSFEIDVQGLATKEAFLETRVASKGRYATPDRLAMTQIQKDPLVFATALAVGNETLEYRFSTGDAISPYRKLRTTPRPKVVRFHQTIEYPEYTQVALADRSSDRGDARLLTGAKMTLGIDASMPLTSASLRLDDLDSGDKQSIPMEYDSNLKRWSVLWPAQRDARYQVKLFAQVAGADSPIENTFSPFYEVDVVEDQSPSVSWMVGEKTLMETLPNPNQMWIVSPHEFVKLSAALADDLPNATLRQEISVNRQPYKTLELPLNLTEASGQQFKFLGAMVTWTPLDGVSEPTRSVGTWTWDLLSQSLRSGDVVSVRLAARDSADHVSYSVPIQLSLASDDFDRNRHQALYFRSVLGPELQKLADLIRTKRVDLRPKMLQLKDPKLDVTIRRSVCSEVEEFNQGWMKQTERIRALATQMVGKLPRVLDQSETEFVVRAVSKLEREAATMVALAANDEAWTPIDVQGKGEVVPDKLAQMLQQQIDRSVGAFDEAESATARLSDIYRQLLGHEYLTAMTKDLLVLRDHQRKQIEKTDPIDFVTLARTQTIADQYFDGALQLGSKMESYLAPNLRDQSRNLMRLIEQTRQEIRDLSLAEPSPQALASLRQRIERSYNDLNSQHWAFNLDGGLLSNISDVRRDLILRGSGVGTALQRSIDTLSRTTEWASDSSLDSEVLGRLRSATLDELTLQTLPASDQITDRRDFHLERKPIDAMFPSDMGLASRAWSSVIGSWLELPSGTPQWKQTREDLLAIAKAYRVLESAHELQDIRLNLDVLRRQEQYDWQTSEGRLSHLRQWDSMNHRCDLTHTWMKESGFPAPVADRLNGLRWGAMSNAIRQKLDPRRSANNETMLNAAPEIGNLLGEFDAILTDAQPTIDEARKLLSRFSPTVSQLAQIAAEKTRQLEQKTQNPETTAQENAQQQEQVEQSIEQLQDALLEMATKQDILNDAQLQAAKDSDRALSMIDAVQEPMEQANQKLLDAQENSQDATQVAQAAQEAAEKQQQTAEALETIAKHFERVEEALANPQPSNLAAADESRARMQPESNQSQAKTDPLAQAKSLLDNYQQAEQLNDLAKNSPEELLKLLEAELQRNEPMQKELSEISKDNVSDAAAELRNAAQRESTLAQQLENSDVQSMDAKAVQAQQLKALAQNAESLAANVLNKAQTPIQRINQKELQKNVAAVSESLLAAAKQAQGADPNASQKLLQEKTDQLMKEVQKAQQQLGEMNPNLNQLVDQSPFKEDKQRQAQLTEAQSTQSLMRDQQIRQTKDMARRREQVADQLGKETEARERELQQKNTERGKVMEALQKKPEDAGLQAQVDQKTREVFQAMQRANSAKQISQSAQEIANNAKQSEQRTEAAQRANLDAPNPMAALAREQIQAAKEQLDQLQSQLQGLQGQVAQPPARSPSSDALAQGDPTQKNVEGAVDQVANQLTRSARHEERLNNQQGKQQLEQQANQVNQKVKPDVERATEQVNRAAGEAKQQLSNQLQEARQNGAPQPQRAPNAEAPLAALNQAKESLSQQATELSGLASRMDQPSGQQPSGQQPSGQQAIPQSAKELARMLDALDQQIASSDGPQGSEKAGEDQAGKNQERKPQGGKESDAASANPQGSEQANAGAKTGSEKALASAADQIASQLQNQRMANRNAAKQRSQSAKKPNGESSAEPDDTGLTENQPVGNSALPNVMLDKGMEWGRLRQQRAEQVIEGKREFLDPEFGDAIRAYYRALGKQWLDKKPSAAP